MPVPERIGTGLRGSVLAIAICALCGSGPRPARAEAAPEPPARPHETTVSATPSRDGTTIYRDSIIVAAPPETVWRVLTDYERLPQFIPGLERSRVLQDSLGVRRVEQIGAAGWLFLKLRARVVLRVQEQACSRIDFRAVGGDFDVFEGWWSLLPENGGRETMLKYWADVQPSFRAPGFLTRFLVRRGLRERLVALQVRVAGGKARKRS